MFRALIAFVAAVLLVASADASAAKRVTEFRGSGNTTTAIFRVESPWILDWRLDGDYSQLVALDITLIDATTGAHVGRVLHTKRKGNGLKLFKKGGRYQLRISTTLGRWRVKIQSISDDEVERYTPRFEFHFGGE